MAWELMQCNVCGGELVFDTTTSVYRCRCCRATYEKKEQDVTLQTDMRQALNLRQSAKFVEARDIYKRVIAEHPDEDLSDAYWGLFLCEQNVLFEVDGKGEMFPSFYRVTGDDASESPACDKAIAYARRHDRGKMDVFCDLADRIDTAKRKYRTIAETTKPYDIFICFKKTGDDGKITPDTQLATDLYNDLARDYNVFFSEKSLHGTVVREYEPNIYYALYTAKVMLLLCSKKEYIESQWLRNEWGRFTKFSKDAEGKAIIPIFLDGFNPSNLPDELWHEQGIADGRHLLRDLGDALKKIIHPVDEVEEMKRQFEEMMRVFQTTQAKQPVSTLSVSATQTEEEQERKAEEERKRREAEETRRKVEEAKKSEKELTFGSYYKDSESSKSPIEWIVLKREGNKALLISKYGIDCRPYNPKKSKTTWETAPLREWLNNEFLNTAFSRAEQSRIQSTRVVTPDRKVSWRTVKGGNPTTDKIFLLSIDEAKQYFSSNDDRRKCAPTAYAVSKGAYRWDKNGCGWWWLRSPGNIQNFAAYVFHGGGVSGDGRYVDSTFGCVRPALWVNLDS